MELTLSHFDFMLPPHLIAQDPCTQRDHSRLLVLDRKTGNRGHHIFNRITDYLNPGDVLVINNTKVVPARLEGKKKSGGRVECLVLNYPVDPIFGACTTSCLLKARRKMHPGERLNFGPGLEGEILPPSPNGTALVRFVFEGSFDSALKRFGSVPLPPYIKRNGLDSGRQEKDLERYQTVYALYPGAIAAPTAGLHFSLELMTALQEKGIFFAPITLHVGYGTFAPIKTENIAEHKMHTEAFQITAQAAEMIEKQKSRGKRIIAVGTTSARVLEYQAVKHGCIESEEGECDFFIRPGYSFQMIDGLITNFHLPRTTLLLLVSAFAGREKIFQAYQEAVELGYRFYSYGDAMLII
jgi:S-adenosylmethionine:tRNA ribosyltransferase-isomerase